VLIGKIDISNIEIDAAKRIAFSRNLRHDEPIV
jgi:hypothetical protein